MPNVNLTDSRNRDAVVKAESTRQDDEIRYVDEQGNHAHSRKVLKASVDHDYDTLIQRHDNDPEKLALALIDTDPEVDLEKCGVFLWGVSKVYVNSEDGIVYRIEQFEIVKGPDGEQRERRNRRRPEANVDTELPLQWSGKKIAKQQAARQFLFASKLQIVHINGLTYDFLYGMAKELSDANSLMMVGGGSKGRDPLVFRRGSVPYRGFLEGRVDGDRYILLLHLSNMELKLPVVDSHSETTKTAEPASKATATKAKAKAKAKASQNEESVTSTTDNKKNSTASKKLASSTQNDQTVKPAKDDSKETAEKATKTANPAAANSTPNQTPAAQSNTATNNTELPSADDLGVWLKSIRMGKYLPLFIENEIDVDVLADLTEQDLIALEIPVGSRRRLLKAVAESDNLRAEVAMAVNNMLKTTTASSVAKKSSKKNTKTTSKKNAKKAEKKP